MRTRVLALIVTPLLAAAPASAAVEAGSATATSGAVSATLSWQSGTAQVGERPTLSIRRGGATLVDAVDLTTACAFCPRAGVPANALHVRDVNGDGEPDVLVDLFVDDYDFGAGPHCCALTMIYTLDEAADGYASGPIFWGNARYRLEDLDGDGQPEFVSRNDEFTFVFDRPYAFAWRPPRIEDLEGSVVVDRISRFPRLVRRDMAAVDARLARAKRSELRALVSARAGDMQLLGLDEQVRPYLSRARRRHWISSGDLSRLLVFFYDAGER